MHIALAGPTRLVDLTPDTSWIPTGLGMVPGGSPVTALARALVARDHEVSVLTLALGIRRPVEHHGSRLHVYVGPYRASGRARDAFRAERRAIEQFARSSGAALVHAHWTYEFALGAIASELPTIVTVRDWAPLVLKYHPHPYRLVRLAMAAETFRRNPMLTVTSPYMQRLVRRWAHRTADLVPNAIDDADFLDPHDLRWCPDPDRPTLVAINVGFGRRKNVGALLQAFPLVRQRHAGARLVLIGDGHGPDQAAEQYARHHRLGTDGIEFAGSLPYSEAMGQLAKADVFVHPSKEESFGLVLVEAMARGVPVVAGRHSGAVPWVCDAGRAAELVDVSSPRAIAEGVSRLMAAPGRTGELVVRANEQARRRFSLSRVTSQYERLYARAV